MSDHMQGLRDDLDYMKALAREGRQAPIVGGSILVLAAVCFGGASLVMYGMMKGFIPGTQMIANAVWIGASMAFVIGLFATKGAVASRPGASAINNRASSAGWKGVGFSIFAFILALCAAAWRLNDQNMVWMIAPFVTAVYGIGWTVASAMSDRKWLGWVAVASLIASPILGLLAGSGSMFLAYAICLFLLAGLPGLLLMRAVPSDVI